MMGPAYAELGPSQNKRADLQACLDNICRVCTPGCQRCTAS